MEPAEKRTTRTQPWHTLLDGEERLATPVLEALWFQVFDRSFVELAFEGRPKTLRSITTPDAFRQALHDYFAFACAGERIDPLERAVALDFIEDNVADIAPEWAVESDDPDVLTNGIYNYMPEDTADDSWMRNVPASEQGWFYVCELIDLLTEYDDLSVAETARQAMLDEAALKVADVFRFTPALNRDQIVQVWIQMPIIFRIE